MYHRLITGEDPKALKLYEELDGYIKWFIDNAGEANVLLMSDHGFRTYKKMFAINKWLMEEDYLKIKPRQSISSTPKDRTTLKVPLFLVNHQQLFNISSLFYRAFKRILPSITPVIRTTPDTSSIAYSILSSANGNCGGIYINSKKRFGNGSVEAGDYERVRNEIMAKLEQLTDKNGIRIFSSVLRREDIYSGEHLNRAPDIFLFSREYNISPFSEDEAANEHSLDGIFIAYGEEIKQGIRITKAAIVDLAPTILHLMKLPILTDTDGRVLKEIFKEGSEVAKRPIGYQEAGEEVRIKAKIKDKRLKSIGENMN